MTVTPVDGVPVNTKGIWLRTPDEQLPVGRDFQRRDPRRLMALPLTGTLGDVPRGSLIAAALPNSTTVRTWRVDSIDAKDADEIRVLVSPAPGN